MQENQVSHVIIGAAIDVHRELRGPGLVEDVYEEALCRELELRRMPLVRQFKVPLVYKGHRLKKPLYLDVLVHDLVIVECKASEQFHPIWDAQLLTYLRLTEKKLGLIINFGEKLVSDGVRRVVNGL